MLGGLESLGNSGVGCPNRGGGELSTIDNATRQGALSSANTLCLVCMYVGCMLCTELAGDREVSQMDREKEKARVLDSPSQDAEPHAMLRKTIGRSSITHHLSTKIECYHMHSQ